MRGSRASLTRVEREQEILRIAEALAQRGFYVFGPGPAAALTDPAGVTPGPRGSPARR